MATEFTGQWKQGRHTFTPGQIIAFGDPDGDAFFKAVGVGKTVDDSKAHFTLSEEECSIDPATVFPDGNPVLESPAKKAVADPINPTAAPGTIQPADGNLSIGA